MVNIGQTWLDYYQSLGYIRIPSAPLVHPAFPTSFNMSAGMVQMDPQIRSTKKITPSKKCLVQKCIRHFDIDKVGNNNYLSFFEMTGAFEINEFNEKQTIICLWKFLTEKLFINPKKLWITAFDKDKVVDRQIFLPNDIKQFLHSLTDNRVVFGDQKTNLWSQGGGVELIDNIKLCGPQIEFFYDLGEEKGCGKGSCNPFCGCGRFIEICNTLLIFYLIDYGQIPTLKKIVNPSTETVIGIERCALILENKKDVFETSFFTPLIRTVNGGILNDDVKIIVDHIKSLAFIFAEQKILPAKSDRGRIIRTLIRNLLTSYYVLKINPHENLPLLIDEVINLYKEPYPEILNCKNTTLEVVFDHEIIYKKTLQRAKQYILSYFEKNKTKDLNEEQEKTLWLKFGVPAKLIPTIY